jgi:hypothetical protein
MADLGSVVGRPRRLNWPVLIVGMTLAAAASLSIHVVMIEALGIAYPQDGATPAWARFINTAGSIAALVAFYALAAPKLAARHVVLRVLIVFAVYAMVKETLRGMIMNGVVTTGWASSLVTGLPDLAYLLVAAALVVFLTPLIPRGLRMVGGVVLGAALYFVIQPAIQAAFAPLLAHLAHLARPDMYQLPYPMVVMVPAYLTFAEPAIGCVVMAALVWDRLATSPVLRLLQFAALVMFIKGAVFRILLYSFFIKASLPAAWLSEGQFTLEFFALAVFTGLIWQAARGRGAGFDQRLEQT